MRYAAGGWLQRPFSPIPTLLFAYLGCKQAHEEHQPPLPTPISVFLAQVAQEHAVCASMAYFLGGAIAGPCAGTVPSPTTSLPRWPTMVRESSPKSMNKPVGASSGR